METGFYRLQASNHLPADLRDTLPEILWFDGLRSPETSVEPGSEVILTGIPLGGEGGDGKVLLARKSNGGIDCFFDLPRTVEGILLEGYHSGLEQALEMRLPFNYSLLPQWVKGVGYLFRAGKLSHDQAIAFPSKEPKYAVDWLNELAVWSGIAGASRSRAIRWPGEFRAALTISHDVDTDWIFSNPDWLERICDMEEKHGFFGAWYCVPCNSGGKKAVRGIERLKSRGCEIGCHGYNHDAKWPFLSGGRFQERVKAAQAFRDRWQANGFRSEWLWRTPDFLSAIADVFEYDSSAPACSSSYTRLTRNGCGTCMPYRTFGDMIELPLTLPMDENRHAKGTNVDDFWEGQVDLALKLIGQGGLVMISLHPQPHQAANYATLTAVDRALQKLAAVPKVWIARPDEIAAHAREQLSKE
jgi:peptidoglycan/xylan/chitin deacetylase (PgdA/CDA1 family)